MKKIEFVHSKDLTFRKVSDFVPESFLKLLSPGDRTAEVKTHFPGSEDRLFLIEVKEIPNAQAAHHAHEKEEIFFVLEGEMHFGNRICSTGDSINILGGTLYTFKAGPNGCRYLKFTGTADSSYISKEQYQANQPGTDH